MLHGTQIIKNDKGDRYAGGARRDFHRTDVTAFGRHSRYNDSVVRYQVRLHDGVELMVDGTKQLGPDRKWLRQLAARTPLPVASRELPQADTWITLDAADCAGEALPRTFIGEYADGDLVAVIRHRHGWENGTVTGVLTDMTATAAVVVDGLGRRYEVSHPRDVRRVPR